jgi:hypothetical protein
VDPAENSHATVIDLLAGYEPAHSLAWPGAAPELQQLDLWWGGAEEAIETEGGESAAFRRAGFTVRPIRGRGAPAILDAFCRQHHRYLRTRGMPGLGYGMFTPAGELVGVANFAPCSNPRTAAGMQLGEVPEDRDLSAAECAHVRIGEREYLDCVRLCVADHTIHGECLGTGAESFLYASCLRGIVHRNRKLWRALRMAETGLPLPGWARSMLAAGTPFIKLVRSLADPAENHTGGIYSAAGAWYLGTTRAETVWVGQRSGEFITRRSLSKLRGSGLGHAHQVLRAAYEGSSAHAVARRPDGSTVEIDLRATLTDLPASLDGAELRARLLERWRGIQTSFPRVQWHLSADAAGYRQERRPPKHLYGSYLGTAFWAAQLVRRSKRLRESVLRAEAAWFAEARRWPRSLGYGWQRPPSPLGKPTRPKRPE